MAGFTAIFSGAAYHQLKKYPTTCFVAGTSCIVEATRLEVVENPETVYNFQVEDYHTYYVGESRVLVHNNGDVIDPVSGKVMNKSQPWDMGHKPGYEFRKHQQSAEERGIPRKQFLNEHNNPEHYRPELPRSNRSHKGEDITNNYFGD